MPSEWKISVSKVVTANHCPRQYVIAEVNKKVIYSYYEMGPPIGTTVHSILDKFAKNATSSNKFISTIISEGIDQAFKKGIYTILHEKIKKLDTSRWEADTLNILWKMVETASHEMALVFKDFFDSKQSSGSLDKKKVKEALNKFFLALEWSFKLPIVLKDGTKTLITGRLDWLTIDPISGDAIVWDFKTGDPSNFEYDLQQASLYAFAIKEKLGVDTHASIFYISSSSIIKKEIPRERLTSVQNTIISNLERVHQWFIGKQTPPATTDRKYCEYCRVADFCRKKYGKNPNVPTMGTKWQKMISEVQQRRPKKPKRIKKTTFRTTTIQSELDTIKEKAETKITSTLSTLVRSKSNFILGKLISTQENYEIHPLVFNKHAAILGASGSGKTYLGKKILEEALLKGYSTIIIDPQGDLCSMVLPEDGETDYTSLIKNLNWKIFTPGSEKGIKLSINPLATPSKSSLEDEDYRNAILDNTSLLILMIIGYNIKKIPPEKALLEAIIFDSWMKGETLSFRKLASKVEQCEEIYSVTTGERIHSELLISDRNKKKLARNLVKVAVGTEGAFFIGGETLQFEHLVQKLSLYIINLASVGTDIVRRQLVVSWILRQIYDWILTNPQQEQDKIRFFLYIDEVADFLPPHPFNPPSKKMLMLLFRQARKYGVSCIMATQSPAAIDYKSLDNVSTLFIGKIPSEQSRRKMQSYLEPYGYHVAKELLAHSQKASSGEFIIAGLGDPVRFKTNKLRSKHLTLSLDVISKLLKH